MCDGTNMAVVQQVYVSFGQGDIPTLLSLLTDDIEWSLPGPSNIPYAGTRHGHEGVLEFFSMLGETLQFERFEPREFVGQDDTVVVLGYERCLVKPTGCAFEQEWAHVYTLRNGNITRGRFIEDTAALAVAFDAA